MNGKQGFIADLTPCGVSMMCVLLGIAVAYSPPDTVEANMHSDNELYANFFVKGLAAAAGDAALRLARHRVGTRDSPDINAGARRQALCPETMG